MKDNESKFEVQLGLLGSKALFSLHSCKDKWGQYVCLYSNNQEYKQGTTYNLYQFPALLRVLGRKANLFTSSLQQELYSHEDGIVAILDWQGLKREFIHLKFAKSQEEFIVEFLTQNKENLLKYIATLKEKSVQGNLECQ